MSEVLFSELAFKQYVAWQTEDKMRLIQREFLTPSEFSRIYPGLYERLSPALAAGVLALVSIG